MESRLVHRGASSWERDWCIMDTVEPLLERAFELWKQALPEQMNCTGDMTQ